jgi:hypothetical protein
MCGDALPDLERLLVADMGRIAQSIRRRPEMRWEREMRARRTKRNRARGEATRGCVRDVHPDWNPLPYSARSWYPDMVSRACRYWPCGFPFSPTPGPGDPRVFVWR